MKYQLVSSGVCPDVLAQVGFNAGDGVVYYAVPWSRTPEIVGVGGLSNVGTTGRWIFRIDSAVIDAGGCSSTNSARLI